MARRRASCCERNDRTDTTYLTYMKPDQQYRERVYKIVRRIPLGRVMTYGQLAYMLGEGYTPRTVGFVMHGADERKTPWQRVINSQGRCSTGRIVLPSDKQQRMLEREGVKFDAGGRCDLEKYLWHPKQKVAKKETTKARSALYRR
jgi:methylated-DNA-protein-cysteine methyltransferase-like protein